MVSERLWRHALILSALAHAVALGTTGSLARQAMEARVDEQAAAAPHRGGLRGETFEIDGLVATAPSPPTSAPADWSFRRVRQLAGTMAKALSARPVAAPARRPPQTRPRHARARRELPRERPAAGRASGPGPAASAAGTAPPSASVSAASPSEPPGQPSRPRAIDDGSSAPAESGASGTRGGRRYGAALARDGRLLLAPALTRAIPAAVSADPIWSQLSPGTVGAIEMGISLDGDGAVDRVSVSPEGPEALQRLAVRTVALLRAGRFALSGPSGAGRESLRVEVILSDRPMSESAVTAGDTTRQLQLGFEAPTADRPGRGWFILASGRHFEAEVTVLSSHAAGPPTPPLDAGAGGGSPIPPQPSDGGPLDRGL